MNTFTVAISLALLLVGALVTGSCVNLDKSYPQKRYYALDAVRNGAPLPSTTASLKVRPFRISPRYEGRGFVYKTNAVTFESDFYNEFFIDPRDDVTEQICHWLSASGLFARVVDSGSRVETTHTLEGSLVALYGDYSDRTAPRAAIEIQCFLIKDNEENSEIVFQKSYRKNVTLGGDTPEALVQGWNEALRQILGELESDVRGAIAK